MKREILTVREALDRGKALPYILLRSLSGVTMGPNPGGELSTGELLEARFFSGEEEIRIFRREEILTAAAIRAEEGDTILTDTYQVENKKLGCEITLCRHLDWDEDGQAYIAATRLAGWKGAEQNG